MPQRKIHLGDIWASVSGRRSTLVIPPKRGQNMLPLWHQVARSLLPLIALHKPGDWRNGLSSHIEESAAEKGLQEA